MVDLTASVVRQVLQRDGIIYKHSKHLCDARMVYVSHDLLCNIPNTMKTKQVFIWKCVVYGLKYVPPESESESFIFEFE